MTLKQAIEILVAATANLQGTREQHRQIGEALQLLLKKIEQDEKK